MKQLAFLAAISATLLGNTACDREKRKSDEIAPVDTEEVDQGIGIPEEETGTGSSDQTDEDTERTDDQGTAGDNQEQGSEDEDGQTGGGDEGDTDDEFSPFYYDYQVFVVGNVLGGNNTSWNPAPENELILDAETGCYTLTKELGPNPDFPLADFKFTTNIDNQWQFLNIGSFSKELTDSTIVIGEEFALNSYVIPPGQDINPEGPRPENLWVSIDEVATYNIDICAAKGANHFEENATLMITKAD